MSVLLQLTQHEISNVTVTIAHWCRTAQHSSVRLTWISHLFQQCRDNCDARSADRLDIQRRQKEYGTLAVLQ
jgi:hypothetical protein